MNQSMNIFRKDTGLLRIEILVSITMLALFTVLAPGSWAWEPPILFSVSSLVNSLAVLLCLTWIILIISLVQAERLVGLNQFWTTRPYEWPKLMAAKFCFLLAFLYLPLIASQVVLLHRAELPIVHSLPTLLLNLVLFTVAFVLPVVCAAALTRSIARALLMLLALLAVLVGLASLAISFIKLTPQILLPLQIGITGAVLVAALANQYRFRTTLRSFYILIIAPTLVLLAQVTMTGTSLAAIEYPTSTHGPSLSIRLDSDPLREFGGTVSNHANEKLLLHIPLLLDSEIEPGTSYRLDGHRLTLTGADGYTWRSPWLSESGMIAPASASPKITANSVFAIPRVAYDHLSSRPVTIRVAFALAQLQDEPPVASTLSTVGNEIPGLGSCLLDESYSVISCRSAFREPLLFGVQTFRKVDTCLTQNAAVDPTYGLVGDSKPGFVIPHISSVVATPLELGISRRGGYFCPGLPITFVEKRSQRRLRVETPASTIDLKKYIGSVRND